MCSKQNRRCKCKCLNMITRINESKILTKHLSCECECKFDGRKCNSNQKWNNDKCHVSAKIQNNIIHAENSYLELYYM